PGAAATHARVRAAAAPCSDNRDRAYRPDRRAARDPRRQHAYRRADRAQAVLDRDGPATSAQGAAVLPDGRRRYVPGRQEDAGVLQQAGRARDPARPAVCRAAQDRGVLGMDDDARPDREDAANPPAALGPTGWLGSAEAAPADRSRVPARSG